MGTAKADVDGNHLWVVLHRWTQTAAILGVEKKRLTTVIRKINQYGLNVRQDVEERGYV